MEVTFDLETTALDPMAGVMQLAAVAWHKGGKNFVVRDKFNQGIDLRELFMSGEFTFDPETMKFWAKQSAEAKQGVLSAEAHSLKDVVTNFTQWLADLQEEAKDEDKPLHLWAQGSDFDIPKLQHLYRVAGVQMPWKYNEVRCARTFALELGRHLFHFADPKEIYKHYPELIGTTHDALFDATRTAKTTWHLMEEFN